MQPSTVNTLPVLLGSAEVAGCFFHSLRVSCSLRSARTAIADDLEPVQDNFQRANGMSRG